RKHGYGMAVTTQASPPNVLGEGDVCGPNLNPDDSYNLKFWAPPRIFPNPLFDPPNICDPNSDGSVRFAKHGAIEYSDFEVNQPSTVVNPEWHHISVTYHVDGDSPKLSAYWDGILAEEHDY